MFAANIDQNCGNDVRILTPRDTNQLAGGIDLYSAIQRSVENVRFFSADQLSSVSLIKGRIIIVNNCCVFGCSSQAKKGCRLSFFRFPFHNQARLELWINAVRRAEWKPRCYSRICSLNFIEGNF